jgi:phosphatidylinositol alpha-mannosyltransferase
VQSQVLGLARAFSRSGHQVTVFAPLDGTTGAPEGIDLVSTGGSVSLPANGSVAPVAISPVGAARALRTLQAIGFDVVHVHEPFAPGLPYGLLVARHVPPLVATFHRSGGSALYTVLGPLARRLARRFVVRAAVSEAARSTAFGALGGSYEVGFNGVEVDRFEGVEPWPTDRPTVLFLGRHEERKGLRTLLDAFESLRTDPPHGAATSRPPLLWIAGDGPLTESLRRLHPPSADICWLGVLSEEEKVRRLVAADVLCAPSLGGESFGVVLLEAMAARAVVVASDIDGYRDAADGHAVLVAPADRWSLAEALSGVLAGRLALAGSPEGGPTGSRDRWLSAAAERADGRSMERLAQWYEGLYRSVMVPTRA